jgi:hypothetical protein
LPLHLARSLGGQNALDAMLMAQGLLPGRTIVSFFSLRKHRRGGSPEKPSHVDG